MGNSSMPREEREYLRHLRDVHFREQGGRCYFCDCEMTPADVPDPKPGTTVTIEHLKGRASGGGSNYLNTAASCLDCNTRRSRQRQVGKKTVPRATLVRRREFTYAYTTPSDPVTLVLFNSTLGRDEAMLAMKKAEGQPINLKFASELQEPL